LDPNDIEEAAMLVEVDLTKCQDHGQCVFAAPAVFSLDNDGKLAFRQFGEAARRIWTKTCATTSRRPRTSARCKPSSSTTDAHGRGRSRASGRRRRVNGRPARRRGRA
jgi:ferredoxin